MGLRIADSNSSEGNRLIHTRDGRDDLRVGRLTGQRRAQLLLGLLAGVACLFGTEAMLQGAEVQREQDRVWIEPRGEWTNVSLIELLINPDRYHGQLIGVDGFVTLRFEHLALTFSQELSYHYSSRNSIWLYFDRDFLTEADWKRFNHRFVYIIGLFDKNSHGHLGAYPGTIKMIREIRTESRMEDGEREKGNSPNSRQ